MLAKQDGSFVSLAPRSDRLLSRCRCYTCASASLVLLDCELLEVRGMPESFWSLAQDVANSSQVGVSRIWITKAFSTFHSYFLTYGMGKIQLFSLNFLKVELIPKESFLCVAFVGSFSVLTVHWKPVLGGLSPQWLLQEMEGERGKAPALSARHCPRFLTLFYPYNSMSSFCGWNQRSEHLRHLK